MPEYWPPTDTPPPKLSVIVVSYNMARELPRTIKTMSPAMQRDLQARDYELIVVDNGSTTPPSEEDLRLLAPNLTVHRVDNARPSPVAAINLGIGRARGEFVGVCIDGARMVSPGLFAMAITAAESAEKPVVGTIAFHLGPKAQNEGILDGYNQNEEDALLASVPWEQDAYRLFDISVLAGSSKAGWFVTPAESNALFLRKRHWRELGGYDARFEAPGGGLANLDMWKRACEDPGGDLIMLLGEATFHQVHGGIATNNPVSPWDGFHAEYARIRSQPYRKPERVPRFFGSLRS